ncbi:helix-turn-helix domain-containing protein [Planctomicrobium piriforme]|uniref:AraC-like ligand binding domain-containing protein n=1 Tax=Planctomicrobium piriforme TaxID=1576369 RepID=A0A1I3B5I7_9PLAN|nr:AraC family transcriptional regulator [Planctomicrobium piriforme]SFH57544.1 AraC-like ligand binding domain-containing protein [Planctomicrobium piriforme]
MNPPFFHPDSLPAPSTYEDVFAGTKGTVSKNDVEFRSSRRRSLQLGRVRIREAFPGPPMPYYWLRFAVSEAPATYEMNYGDGWFRRQPNSFILVPPNAECRMRGDCRGDFESLFLAFPETEVRQIAGELLETEGAHLLRAPKTEIADPYVGVLLKQLWAQSGETSLGSDIMVEGTFISLLGRLLMLGEGSREMPAVQERGGAAIVDRAVRFMRENLKARVSLEEIAGAARVSRPYLTRIFKRETGRTVHDHLVELRIKHAQELIRYFGKNLTLAEVAEQCGFANDGHLIRAFNQQLGMTPQQFRERV